MTLLPVDVQLREDAALGAAWRRCEAALPEGWSFRGLSPISPTLWHSLALGQSRQIVCDFGVRHDEFPKESVTGPTPTAALEALADKLESLP